MKTIYLYGPILADSENSAKAIIHQIEQADGDITIRIASGGGDIYEAVAITNVLKSHPGKVTAVVDSLAASAASVIAVSADETYMTPHAEMMIHNPWASFSGDADAMIKQAENLTRMSVNIATVYAKKAGHGDTDFWLELMAEESWFSADEAVEAGLADAIYEPENPKTKEAVTAAYAMAEDFGYKYTGRQDAPSPAMSKENDMQNALMNAVAQRLGIAEDAELTEDIILAALDETLSEQANENDASEDNNDVVDTEDVADVEDNNDADTDVVDVEDVEDNNDVDADTEDVTDVEDNNDADADADAEDVEDNNEADEDAEDVEETPVRDDVVTVDKAAFEELQRRAALAEEVVEQQKRDQAEALIAAAISEGKVLPNKKDELVEAAVNDFTGMKNHIDTLVSVIPMKESGRSVVSSGDKDATFTSVKAQMANLFGTPTV